VEEIRTNYERNILTRINKLTLTYSFEPGPTQQVNSELEPDRVKGKIEEGKTGVTRGLTH
jgi:hypothetical protein